MAKKVVNSGLISETRDHIKEVFPHADNISIWIGKDQDGKFKSFIKVHAPTKKHLVAKKKGNTYKESLYRAYKAIVKQIHKVQTKWDRKRTKSEKYIVYT